MRWIPGAAAVATLLLAWQAPAGEGKTDKDLLQGSWQAVSMVFGGKETLEKRQIELTFKGDKVYNKEGNKEPEEGTFKLDSTKKPKEIDINAKEDRMVGIYELMGDTLRIGLDEKERPKDFKGDILIVTFKKKKA